MKLKGNAAGLAFGGYVADSFNFSVAGNRGRYDSDFSFKDAVGRALTGHVKLEQHGENFHVLAFPFELSVGGREPWRAQADFLLQPDGIEFHKVFLANGAQRLDLSGAIPTRKAYRVEGTIQSFDLGGLRELSGIDLADLDGTLDGTLILSGVPQQPRIDAQGSLRNGVFLGMKDLTLLLSLVFVEGRFDVETRARSARRKSSERLCRRRARPRARLQCPGLEWQLSVRTRLRERTLQREQALAWPGSASSLHQEASAPPCAERAPGKTPSST